MKRHAIFLTLVLLLGFGCAKSHGPDQDSADAPAAAETVKDDGAHVDTDADGLSDRDEVEKYQSNPLLKDTDKDGVTDGDEVKKGDSPTGPGQLANPEPPEPTEPESE